MNKNNIKFYYVFAVAGRIIYWVLVVSIIFIVWSSIVIHIEGAARYLLSFLVPFCMGLAAGRMWFYLYDGWNVG